MNSKLKRMPLSVIHQLTSGLPRKINSLVLAAMRMAVNEKKQLITGDMALKVAPEALG